MELNDFIANTLLSITSGVEKANDSSKRFRLNQKIHADGTSGNEIEFDIHVTAISSNEINAKGKLGISVVSPGTDGKLSQSRP